MTLPAPHHAVPDAAPVVEVHDGLERGLEPSHQDLLLSLPVGRVHHLIIVLSSAVFLGRQERSIPCKLSPEVWYAITEGDSSEVPASTNMTLEVQLQSVPGDPGGGAGGGELLDHFLAILMIVNTGNNLRLQ